MSMSDLSSGKETMAREGSAAAGERRELVVDPDMQEIVDGFVVESGEILERLDQTLVTLEERPGDPEIIGEVFRAFHTLKGNSRALEFTNLETLVHRAEDIIRAARDGKMELRPEAIDVVLRAVDITKLMIEDIKNRVVSAFDLSGILAELTLAFEQKYDELARGRGAAAAQPSQAVPSPKSAATTIRVDLGKLNGLINATGELVLNKNQLLNFFQLVEQGMVGPDDISEQLNEILARTNILVSDLQAHVMSTRMQPIGKVFGKYPRVVRDLARDLGKEIELVMSGEETELDNTIIEEISDPLIHLVRNSCDHGIETPDIREGKGKRCQGKLELKAYQEGAFVVIEIRDDGKGMDSGAIGRKAIEKGLITAPQLGNMLKGEILNLIFAPGFSTAEKVTAVSGRGVGMDVVKTNIGRLNGTIELDSEKDKGCTVKIRLPLTLAVTVALEVDVGAEQYLIPQEAIVEIVRIPRDEVNTTIREGKFLFRNNFWNPYLDLKKVLGARGNGFPGGAPVYMVVIGAAEKRAGLLVDNIVQQHEVVIKPLGAFVSHFSLSEVNGATIMGDGRVELVLNPNYFMAAVRERQAGA
jgi:two-component system chemotaxis sensor kinase CheA